MEKEISGVLIVDKPAGITSHDVVARVRRLLQTRRVGHFGTLDPFATGVLPLSIGKATRLSQFYLKSRKTYEGTVRFGFSTDTYDATGNPSSEVHRNWPDEQMLEKVLPVFAGRIKQIPPPFSAKRVQGVRAYQLARQNKPVVLEPSEVEIYAFELLGFEDDGERVLFAVECSGGTYVRSLAHDIGQKVDCPAHLASLRRTAVAEFSQTRAVTLEKLAEASQAGSAGALLVPLEDLLPDCPELVVRGREEASVRNGRQFELAQAVRPDRGARASRVPAMTLLKIVNPERRLIAIARHVSGSVYHPDLVLG
jgi:tRNA pseudouridine55 synthase